MSIELLVADDEPPALTELTAMLAADARVGEIHAARNGAEAIEVLSTRPLGGAFLDIHMPGADGFAVARAIEALQVRPAIVFVTADEAGALDAFEVRAVDYVLKPIRADRVRRALDRVIEASALAAEEASDGAADETVPVTVGSTVRLVRRSEVQWIQAQGDYSRLWTSSGSHLLRAPLSELEKRWGEAGFVRVHRSYLVRLDAVTECRLGGAAPVIEVGAARIPVSRRMVPSVREALRWLR
ncbi:response regulator transcription factor [Leucobacter weissii]|uniref:Response regulator transcription factor n=1 Tax=Leucobacter weissii TaxID=1983706 RepID=A0A939SCF6_9MICO|nr:LytTR family DNA-binding domain-containing protein [Leucobacter weissii]MBO1902395.1 response regulator transcription factor [Leucobacter weissii]